MIEAALRAERAEDFQLAAEIYERALALGDPSPELLVRAACLYWQCAYLPFHAYYQLPDAFVHVAADRLVELLEFGRQRFPANVEIEFWDRYIRFRFANEFTLDEARALMARDPSVLIPAMFVYVASGGAEAETEAMEVLRAAKEDGSAAMLDIASVIESTRSHAQNRRATNIGEPR